MNRYEIFLVIEPIRTNQTLILIKYQLLALQYRKFMIEHLIE